MKKLLLGLSLMAAIPTLAAIENYQIDSAHSFANFTIRHVVAKTAGSLSDIQGSIKIDREKLENSSVQAKIALASISTRHAKRDEHILKPDYLNAAQFAEMTFVSTKVEAINETEGVMTGQLTMHGVTKEIAIPFKVLGFGADPWGGQRVGFEGRTTIKASDFGYAWMKKPNAPVGDEIEITLLIEGLKAK